MNERQIKATNYVETRGYISNREYQEINKVSKRTATTDLGDLVRLRVFRRVGRGKREVKYVLVLRQNDAKMTQKMTQKKSGVKSE